MGDESSSNYTFGDAPFNNMMRVELIGEDHEDIPSDSSDSNQERNGQNEGVQSYLGLNGGISHSEPSFRVRQNKHYSDVYGGDAQLP
jgi:hypothetical protein